MRRQFLGYYPPTQLELDALWDEGLLILDTNALLNLFRYTPSTRDDFLKVLEAQRDRLWLPHQVGFEFHRRRLDVIEQQTEAFAEIEAALESAQSAVSKVLQKFKRHPSLDASTFANEVEASLKQLGDQIGKSREVHKESILKDGGYESTFDKITELYEARVGMPFSDARLSELYKEGNLRYEAKKPPGFKDVDKPEPDRYGDFLLWKQILSYAAEVRKPAIFVTDDAKEDWWYKVNGKTRGARVELVAEYAEVTDQRIHFYTPERFLSFANARGGSEVTTESLTEVEEVSSQRASRVLEQLHVRRVEIERERDLIFRQLRSIAHGEPSGLDMRRIRDAENSLQELHHRLYENANAQAELRDRMPQEGPEREAIAYELGRLETEMASTEAKIESQTESLHRLTRKLNRRGDPAHMHRLEARLDHLSQQADDLERTIRDMEDM